MGSLPDALSLNASGIAISMALLIIVWETDSDRRTSFKATACAAPPTAAGHDNLDDRWFTGRCRRRTRLCNRSTLSELARWRLDGWDRAAGRPDTRWLVSDCLVFAKTKLDCCCSGG